MPLSTAINLSLVWLNTRSLPNNPDKYCEILSAFCFILSNFPSFMNTACSFFAKDDIMAGLWEIRYGAACLATKVAAAIGRPLFTLFAVDKGDKSCLPKFLSVCLSKFDIKLEFPKNAEIVVLLRSCSNGDGDTLELVCCCTLSKKKGFKLAFSKSAWTSVFLKNTSGGFLRDSCRLLCKILSALLC